MTYVKIQTKDTMNWLRIGWEGQTVLMHLMRKVNSDGKLPDDVGDDPADDVALITGLPYAIADDGLLKLIDNGVVKIDGDILFISVNWLFSSHHADEHRG
jgi:hypothetical protein